ncbi:MAG: tRNA (adenosine(37)-N6)-threonylcarbamoyltransferase complex dimerization subunit type 1 TsaB [Flavobacterium sp.]
MNTNYIIQIETATKNCSVALSGNGETIALKEIAETGFTHAENLHVFIDEILRENGIHYKQISAVAVSQGPGSYTGLRIGVSAAKGLCFALDVPLIALDTLEILSKQLKVEEGLIVPMLDARRMEVYTAIFSVYGEVLQPVHAKIIDAEAFSEFKNETLHLFGDGANKCKEILNSPNIIYHSNILYPSAGSMSNLAFAKFSNQEFENVAYFEPYYLKEFFTGN